MTSTGGFEIGSDVWVPCAAEVWRVGKVVDLDAKVAVVEVDLPRDSINAQSPRDALRSLTRSVEADSQKGVRRLSGSSKAERVGGKGNPRPGVEPVEVPLWPTKGSTGTLHPRNEALKTSSGALAYSDLSHLPLLHEPAILQALQLRFAEDVVYTLTGPVLLAVNPFRELPNLYGAEQLARFAEPPSEDEVATPHIYGVACAAYHGVWRRGVHQTVLVSGESGAGKTETTKFVMRFLTMTGGGGAESSMSDVERQVLQSIPVLEALGNAKTLRNENSSRFGKFIELQFGYHACQRQPVPGQSGDAAVCPPRLIGARTHTYLLEKVRVIGRQRGERSFHIFYQVLAASARSSDSGEAAVDGLSLGGATSFQPQDFDYLKGSCCAQLDDRHDESTDFDETRNALHANGMSETDVLGVICAVISVLHLGNIAFAAPKNNSEGSQAVSENASGVSLSHACRLLGVEPAALERAICWQSRKMPGRDGGMINSPLTVAKATDSRDALARHLYGAVFSFIVDRINIAASAGGAKGDGQYPFVGLLDIFGFEYFEMNSFEQLCINFTNELLQQYFNEVIFEHEAELYDREGVPWDPLDFPDNTMSVELIGNAKDGILPMLDEECQTVGGSSEQWCNKLQRVHCANKLFSNVRQRQGHFVIQHFAGPVEYTSNTFLEKNRDELSADLAKCLKESSDDFMRQRFVEHDRHFGTQESFSQQTGSRRVARAKQYSVSGEFRGQLQMLMKRIKTTEPHFVRCIKPNPESKAHVFHRPSVVRQLRYQGVLQAIEVSRAGYPMRLKHRQGVMDFRSLAKRQDRVQLEAQIVRGRFGAAAQVLFHGLADCLPEGSWALGKTLVFLKREGVGALSVALLRVRREATVCIQAAWRRVFARRRFLAARGAVVWLQAVGRGMLARRLARAWRRERAALVLQRWRRMAVARRLRQQRLEATFVIQAWMHGLRCRARLLQVVVASFKLQQWWRRSMQRRLGLRKWRFAVLLQRVWRGHQGRLLAREAQVAELRRRTAGRKLLWAWRRHICRRLLHLAAEKGPRSPASRNSVAPSTSSKEVQMELEEAARSARLHKVSRGELLAAREVLKAKNAELSKRASALRRQANELQLQALELARWTPLGILGQVSAWLFGCDCAARDRREGTDERRIQPVQLHDRPLSTDYPLPITPRGAQEL